MVPLVLQVVQMVNTQIIQQENVELATFHVKNVQDLINFNVKNVLQILN